MVVKTSISGVSVGQETTHSTDQPEGKAVKPASTSSTAISENKATSKAEYTNTQQGLPITGYTIVR